MEPDLSIIIEKGHLGLARVGRDLRVVSRRGVLSSWLPAPGQSCCDCPLFFGMESDLLALCEGADRTITLPGVHMSELGEGMRANVCAFWDETDDSILVLTQIDYGIGEIEALLATERRNQQMSDERLLAETERANVQTRLNAVAQERARIARDMHDTLIQSMMALLTQLRLVIKLFRSKPDAAGAELTAAEALARRGLENARITLSDFRNRVTEEITLGAKIRSALAALKSRLNIRVTLNMDPVADDLRGEIAYGLARVFDEALRNVERHARARTLDVSLLIEKSGASDSARLTIVDNGVGFDTSSTKEGHYGLVGMIEQIELLGGSLAIESTLGTGTCLDTRVPLPKTGKGHGRP